MADCYIDQHETILYGRFAVTQMLALLIGLDADFDSTLKVTAGRVEPLLGVALLGEALRPLPAVRRAVPGAP